MNKQVISDLTLILEAVNQVRTEYNKFVEAKFQEQVQVQNPQTPEEFTSLYKKVSTSFECFQEYQKLITLYGCIGAQAPEYIQALKDSAASKGAA